MATSKFKNRLAKMQKAYEKAEKPGGGAECNVPGGKYRAQIIGAELGETNSGDLKIKWTYKIDDGDYEGEEVVGTDNISTEQNLAFLKQKLARLGYDPDEVDLGDDLEGILEQVVELNTIVSIQIKEQKDSDFVNIYVNKVLDQDEAGDDGDEEKKPTGKGGKNGSGKKPKDEAEPEDDGDGDGDGDGEEVELEKGMAVLHKPKGQKKPSEFTIVKLNEKAGTVDLKDEDGKLLKGVDAGLIEPVAAEDGDDDAGDGDDGEAEGPELEKGSSVKVKYNNKTYTGTVTAIDEDSETCKVKIPKLANKIVKVGLDDIELDD